MFFKKYLIHSYDTAADLNDNNVYLACKSIWPISSILDIGCWDGVKTMKYAENAQATNVYGIELVPEKAKEAWDKWIITFSLIADRDRWPFEDWSLDCVISNQVIEHLSNVDHFISESSRVLKKWGYLITSTNNLSSWHNIFALIMWWAPFDLSNSSTKMSGIGNPLAAHKGEMLQNGASWCHKTIYTTRWLNDWMNIYDFIPIKHFWAGYYPFASKLGFLLKKHSAFITLINQKN